MKCLFIFSFLFLSCIDSINAQHRVDTGLYSILYNPGSFYQRSLLPATYKAYTVTVSEVDVVEDLINDTSIPI